MEFVLPAVVFAPFARPPIACADYRVRFESSRQT